MPRTVSCSGPKNYITLEEHLQLFESPERTGQNSEPGQKQYSNNVIK